MRPDIQGLEFTRGEIRRLSGVGFDAVYRPSTWGKFAAELAKTGLIIVLLALSCGLLSVVMPERLLLLAVIHGSVALGLLVDDLRRIAFSRRHRHLANLLDEIAQFNAVVRAIDINDQIEAVGNPGVAIQDRDRVIEALDLTREDIVRALRTERILRKNAQFIRLNPELFANNLKTLTALQVSDQASEHARLLNEALQIAVGVREEMRKLQGQRP